MAGPFKNYVHIYRRYRRTKQKRIKRIEQVLVPPLNDYPFPTHTVYLKNRCV